jgi:acyl dehydratase
MSADSEALRAGAQFQGAPYLLDAGAAEAYGNSVAEPSRRRRKNIHSDADAAAKAGFAAPIAAGEQTIAVMAQLLIDRFGMRLLRGGRIDVALVRPVLYGDTLIAKAEVERADGDHAELRLCVENQRGENVLTGSARVRSE